MREIRFDDIGALHAEVSEDFGDFGPDVGVTQSVVNAFADLSGDRQWIHVDVERAERESPFGGTVAHGFLLLALLPRIRPPQTLRIVGHGSAANYGAESLRFASPVRTGSRICARSRLAAVEQRAKGTLTTTETAIHVLGEKRPALTYRSLILYRPPAVAGRAGGGA